MQSYAALSRILISSLMSLCNLKKYITVKILACRPPPPVGHVENNEASQKYHITVASETLEGMFFQTTRTLFMKYPLLIHVNELNLRGKAI